MELLTDPNIWLAFLTLAALEIVLGVDNIIFISILVGRLPEKMRQKARMIGLSMALIMRVVLLFSITWIMGLTEPIFHVLGKGVSGRDIILIGGGLFLIWKSVHEIHNALEGAEESHGKAAVKATFGAAILQIAIIDMVFSFDSVITAVGMVKHIEVMIAAVIVSIIVMMVAAKSIGEFVDRHPTIKMLALSFLVLIGVTLIAEGGGVHVPKGYIYFAMAFSVGVELLNMKMRARGKAKALKLHKHMPGTPE
jgi:predicted tellurium resistance membrane protein TerC